MILTNYKKYFCPVSKFLCLLIFLIPVLSCTKIVREVKNDPPPAPANTSYKNGIFVVNEGNFNWGNASITFINANDSVEQDVYAARNDDNHLGDVAESMQLFNDKGYIIVNNSNKIQIVSLEDFKSVKTLSGFNSPRFMAIVDSTKAYVTNMQRNISVIDLTTLSIKKTIPTLGWTEALIQYNNYMFVSSIGIESEASSNRNARILVIDLKSDMIVDSIKTGKEPVNMVMDKKDKIWVLCTGGYDHFEAPTLVRIDPNLRVVDKVFNFPNSNDTPSRLCINGTRDTLYFLNNGIYQMPVSLTAIPASPFIPSNGHLLYGLGIHPLNGTIFVSDAKDYIQNGEVYQYDQVTGKVLNSFPAGRIPGSICFTAQAKKK